jgi:type II secretion system protein N
MELKSIDTSVSLLSLFIGQAKVSVEMVARNNGTLDTSVSWSIWQLLLDRNYVPKHISLEAHNFELGGIVTVALHHSARTANDMIKDLLVQLIFQGNLSGRSEIKLASDDPLQSTGDVDLKIDKASLDLANPTLEVAKQNFKRANIKASFQGGRLQIDNKSGFETQEIKADLRGLVTLKNPFQNSILDITIPLKLEGTLKDNFGFILSMVGGSEGQLNYQISGTIARPAFQGNG